MRTPDATAVTGELRAAVAAVVAELGPVQPRIAPGWSAFATACGIEDTGFDHTTIVIGAAADVLKHAASASASAEFGFVTEVAQRTRRWPRSKTWHFDTTLELWRNGWTPIVVHRVLGCAGRTESEFAVGVARPTPPRVGPASGRRTTGLLPGPRDR